MLYDPTFDESDLRTSKSCYTLTFFAIFFEDVGSVVVVDSSLLEIVDFFEDIRRICLLLFLGRGPHVVVWTKSCYPNSK